MSHGTVAHANYLKTGRTDTCFASSGWLIGGELDRLQAGEQSRN